MKKKLEKKINLFLTMIIVLVLMPLLLTILMQRMELAGLIQGMPRDTEAIMEAENPADHMEMENAESRIIGIVAKEISATGSKEAIMAQCVIARTNLYAAQKAGTAEPEALDISAMQNLWGENFQGIYRRLQECVERTKGEALFWKEDYIYAAYHAVSAGSTREMAQMYEDTDMPYLTERICPTDSSADGYLAVYYYDEKEFMQRCREYFPDAFSDSENAQSAADEMSEAEELSYAHVIKRDGAGYVIEMQMGNSVCSGEDFRECFDLNSACFTITLIDAQVRIVTKGLGHGFGLSQYTAEHMASEGSDYRQILEYFYPDTELRAE